MISTHVLDLTAGKPASGVYVELSFVDGDERTRVAAAVTDKDGRVGSVDKKKRKLVTGVYELMFETGAYFIRRNIRSFHPRVTITFEVRDPAQHYHVPLLLSPFGYSTYRGS